MTQFGRSVSAPPDARRAYRGCESGSASAPLNELRRPSTTGGAGTQSMLPNRLPTIQRPQGTVFDGYGHGRPSTTGGAGTQGTLPNRLPTIQRSQGTVFDGYGHGPDIRAQSERGHANQQMIVPRGPSPSYSAPRSSGGVSRGGTPSGGGTLRR